MVEREQTAIREVEIAEDKLRGATRQYLRGEINLEEYNERIKNGPRLDFRKIVAEQQRREMERNVERIKEKVNSFVNSVLKRNP